MRTDATAAAGHRWTVVPMTTDPITRCTELITAVVHSGLDTAPLLAFSALTVTRHYELLDGDVRSEGGSIHIAPTEFNQVSTTGRTVPLAAVPEALLGGHEGDVTDLLRLPVAQRGALVADLRTDLRSLETCRPVELESLHLVTCEALLHMADGTAGRQAVLAYAGIPAATPVATKQRAAHLPGSLTAVVALLDELAHHSGLVIETAADRRHA